jgi:hypothetical protein
VYFFHLISGKQYPYSEFFFNLTTIVMKQPFTSTFYRHLILFVCCGLLFGTASSLQAQAQDDFMRSFFDPNRIMFSGDNDNGVPDYRETIYGGRPDSLTRYRWNMTANNWAEHYGELVTYNAQGQIATATYTDRTGTMFVRRLRETKTYDAANRFLSSTIAVWRNSAWQDTLRSEFTYNAEGRVSMMERSHRPAGDWQRQSATQYMYANNDRGLLSEYIIRNWVDGAYVNVYRGVYAYNEGNTSVATLLEQDWNATAADGGAWRDVASTAYTFNDQGQWTSSVTSRANAQGELTPQTRLLNVTWHNYAQRQMSMWLEQNNVNNNWVTSEAGRIAYGNNGGTTTSIGSYTNGVLADSTRESITFNNIGLYTGTRVERYQAENWVISADTVNTFTFDTGTGAPTAASRVNDRITQIYNPQTNQLVNARRVQLIYVTTSAQGPLALRSSLDVYPNPASEMASIRLTILQPSPVSIQLYDMTGRVVREIAQHDMHTGEHQLSINTATLGQGVYLLRVNSDGQSQVRKLVVSH